MISLWVKIDDCSETYLCNKCGSILDFNGIYNGHANYCPMCGKKMFILRRYNNVLKGVNHMLHRNPAGPHRPLGREPVRPSDIHNPAF